MTPILNQYNDKQYRVSGSHGTYKIDTNFLARTQPSWYVALQNRLHVVEVINNHAEHTSRIIFSHSSKNENLLADILEELKGFLR